jgi:hypothetical protein
MRLEGDLERKIKEEIQSPEDKQRGEEGAKERKRIQTIIEV